MNGLEGSQGSPWCLSPELHEGSSPTVVLTEKMSYITGFLPYKQWTCPDLEFLLLGLARGPLGLHFPLLWLITYFPLLQRMLMDNRYD